MSHEEDPPTFMQAGKPFVDESGEDDGDPLVGTGTSPGITIGRARIVPGLSDIGRLESGDILICHGTDPGWASAFSIVSAVIAQTGGMLAHFSCLSRESGIPAVSLPGAMGLIEDGSTIKVDGTTGRVEVVS